MMNTLTNRNLVFVLSLVALLYTVLVVFISVYHYLPVMQNAYVEIVLFAFNMTFLFMTFGLIVFIVKDLFPSGEKNNELIRSLLIFVSALMIFSRIQETNLTWGVHEQFFATYFFPLLTFYLLSKFSLHKNRSLLFGAILSGILSVVLIYSMGILYVSDPVSGTVSIYSMEFTKYFLTYVGGIFYYISGKECVSIAVIAGLFLLGTLLYFGYLTFIKKVKNPLYWPIFAFLFVYILLAFVTVQNELNSETHYMFKYEYMTISLIAWNLLIILYVHLFKENEKMLHKILILGMTLSVFLLGYQLTIFKSDPKDLLHKKTAAFALEIQIQDSESIKVILEDAVVAVKEAVENPKDKRSIFEEKDINMQMVMEQPKLFIKENLSIEEYIDIKDTVSKIGTILDDFPQKNLVGYLDSSILVNEKKSLVRIHGWVYDMHKKNVPKKLYVVNGMNQVLGYVYSGVDRTDVRHIYGKRSLFSGFIGYVFDAKDIDKIFLVDIKNKSKLELKFTTDSQ